MGRATDCGPRRGRSKKAQLKAAICVAHVPTLAVGAGNLHLGVQWGWASEVVTTGKQSKKKRHKGRIGAELGPMSTAKPRATFRNLAFEVIHDFRIPVVVLNCVGLLIFLTWALGFCDLIGAWRRRRKGYGDPAAVAAAEKENAKTQTVTDPQKWRKVDREVLFRLCRHNRVEDLAAMSAKHPFIDWNCTDQFGNTPLIAATQNGSVETVSWLLLRGANVRRRNHKNHSAEDYARLYGYTTLEKALKGASS